MTRSARKPLEKELCEKTMRLALDNARQFLEDAEALSAQGRHRSAILLGVHAFEEIGRAGLLVWAKTLHPQSNSEWEKFWDAFYDHQSKLRVAESNTSSTYFYEAMGMDGDELGSYHIRQAKIFHDLRMKVAYVEISEGTVDEPRIALGNQCSELLSAVRSALQSDRFLPPLEPKNKLRP